MPKRNALAIGIDLGTTYSCVAVCQHDKVEIIANDQGNRTTPSYVAFTNTEHLVGDPAKSQASLNPQNTVFAAKRLIGRKYEDPTVQEDIKHWPFTVVNHDGKLKVQVSHKGKQRSFYPEEISAMVLGKMKQTAEAYLGCSISQAIVTVPAYFNDAQRQATIDAGAIAGLQILKILNEPTAAAIAYGLDARNHRAGRQNILIFDLGGGTFDVSILTAEDGIFEAKATSGDTHLGGEDFDKRLMEHLAEEFRRKHKKDIRQDKKAMQRLKIASERAKCILSSCNAASISIDSLYQGVDFHMTITRARFEDLCADLFRATLKPLERALKDAKMSKCEIKDIVLVGGSTRIPKIQKLLKDFFNGKELCKGINPDEAVAYGAAIQAAILTGNRTSKMQNMFLLDVTPLSLGINTQGGVMATIIKRNSPVPTKETMEFTTTEDDQDTILFMVYEGERALTKHNHLLGTFTLKGILPAPCGVPVIAVTFSIDENNILMVSAKDMETGNTSQLTISDTRGRLGKEEIERIVQQAEEFRVNDTSQQEKIEAMNSLESCTLELKRAAEEQVLDVQAKRRMLEMCKSATSWLEGNPLAEKEECEQRQKDLEKAWDSICTSLIPRQRAEEGILGEDQNVADAGKDEHMEEME
ncbi:heat shock 70 kDa protein II-like [Hemicordylus capensis]|uniref:heat shock 70 kDa protein II-like n=1 Tax=Hemicordylus capensis TaxID=884348 RepID=UPI002303C255|nr:heat shock 70 kDa protein II-like [Hemicordylus capensis]XP_053133792.1 heat shock 70 kDa protein II-like [Hemicordylus capensis]